MSSLVQNLIIGVVEPLAPLILATIFWIWDPFAGIVSRDTWYSEYDYVIVGGGPAGCVLANRLSEDPNTTILLIEAGPFENIITDIPYLAPALQMTAIDWQYTTTPQTQSCLGFKNRSCRWPLGKVLGGSSVHNYMLYVRGNKNDYDRYAALGAKGWSYSEVLPYFIKAEHCKIPELLNSEYHGTKGYLSVERSGYVTPMAAAFIESGKLKGLPEVDYNGAQQMGVSMAQGTVDGGRRGSVAKEYLRPILSTRRNLHVLIETTVTKILFDSNKRAYGVRFDRKLRLDNVVKARKEVILSAGAIASPQLLLLSGVGPKDHLKQMKIPLVADLPGVGANLQEHITPGALIFLINQSVSLLPARVATLKNIEKFFVEGKGPLTSLGGVEAFAFYKTKYAPKDVDWPDIEVQFAALSVLSDNGAVQRRSEGQTDEMWARLAPYKGRESFTVFPIMVRPRSTGTLRLSSRNPYDKPLLDANFFSDPHDIRVMVDGMKKAIAISTAPPLAKFGATLLNVSLPGCEKYDLLSDEGLACSVKTYTFCYHHKAGTTKMGDPSDPMTVVDPQLRVLKVSGLRVVDASVFPKLPSGNTNAPTIMVAEKASDIIKGNPPLAPFSPRPQIN